MWTGITQIHCGKCLNQYFWVFFPSSVSVFELTWLYNYEMQSILPPEHEIGIQENWSFTGKEERKVNYKTLRVQGRYERHPDSSRGHILQSQGIRLRIIVPSLLLCRISK